MSIFISAAKDVPEDDVDFQLNKPDATVTKCSQEAASMEMLRPIDRNIYEIMRVLGTFSATSLQRAYHAGMCAGIDLSDEPFDGDYTEDLFLAHRDEAQNVTLRRRQRRRELEMFSSFLDVTQAVQELGDAQSDSSDISVDELVSIDGAVRESKVSLKSSKIGYMSPKCTDDCAFQGWTKWTCPKENDDNREIPSRIWTGPSPFYEDLPEHHIRILEIEPGTLDSGLVPFCKLHVLDLRMVVVPKRSAVQDDFEPCLANYEALSYCWGSPHLTRNIICNDIPVGVTQNLLSALVRLRMADRSRFVWVDALCINQSDKFERNAQVSQMLRIYKRAVRVVIWLGGRSPGDGYLAIDFLEFLDHQGFRHVALESTHNMDCMENLARAYSAARELFERPWFRRTWVRQELAAGKKVIVQCGMKTISWDTMKRSSKRLASVWGKLQRHSGFSTLQTPSIHHLQYLKRSWMYGQSLLGLSAVSGSLTYWHRGGLLELLLIGGNFEATDPRDRVYAILGLAREPSSAQYDEDTLFPYLEEGETLEPMMIDYTASVSEVYQRVAKHFVNRDLNLDILCLVHALRNIGSSDLPSWAPDWRVPLQMWNLDGIHLKFFAASYTRAKRQDQTDLGRLIVDAYSVDQIEELLPITAEPWKLLYENGEAVIKSNGVLENCDTLKRGPIFRDFDAVRDRVRCCTTSKGRIALVPNGAQSLDRIYVLLGARLPFVLRSAARDTISPGAGNKKLVAGDEATAVGASFLPGAMLGEVFSIASEKDFLTLSLV